MIFNIDENTVVDAVMQGLEMAEADVTQETANKIVDEIETAMPGIVHSIASRVSEYWISEAENAGGWGSKYAQAIKYKVKGMEAEIYVDEKKIDKKGSDKPFAMFATMMEEGVKSWSIKDALLKSEKAKVSADGVKYIVVPFPVRTPGNSKQGKMRSSFGGREMTKAMYNTIKKGGRLESGTLNVKGKEIDVSGLTRYNTRQLHGQYGVFRCVTSNSRGWVHPGRGKSPIFPSVLKEVNRQISEVISQFCKNIVEEYSS